MMFSYHFFRRIFVITIVLISLLGFVGYLIRDPSVEWALLMYIPLIPLGIVVILLDLFLKGYSLSKFRYGLTFLGLVLILSEMFSMTGSLDLQHLPDPNTQISLLHWNVRWGGKNWKSIREDIEQRHPDILVISEPPPQPRVLEMANHLNYYILPYQEYSDGPIVVCSKWPLKLEQIPRIRKAEAMTVVVSTPQFPLRLLVIDGQRNMSSRIQLFSHEVSIPKALLPRSRTPMLIDIVEVLAVYHAQKRLIDVVVGDFNALSRSLGFQPFTEIAGGYRLASMLSRGWRGTWMSWMPLYDIDHVWIHKRFSKMETKLFTNFATDHRGQEVFFSP